MLKRIIKEIRIAFITVVLLCVHPINVFVVQYITAHEVTLMGITMCLSMICFLKYLERKNFGYYLCSLLLFITALLFQELSIILFFYPLGIIFYLKKEEKFKTKMSFVIPFIGIAMFYIGLKIFITNFPFQQAFLFYQKNLFAVIVFLAHLVGWYLQKLIYPTDILWIWNIPMLSKDYLFFQVILVFIVIGAFLVFIIFSWGRSWPSLAWSWFLVGFFPLILSSRMMPALGWIIEPHWFFFSSIGFFLALGIWLNSLIHRRRMVGWVILTSLILFFSWHTVQYHRLWRNEQTYCEYWQRLSPNNPIPLSRLALKHLSQKDYQLALAYLMRITHNYEPAIIYANMSLCYMGLNQLTLAKENILKAIALDPQYALGYHILGTIYAQEKNFLEAERNFLHAIAIDPYLTASMLNLADLYLMIGQKEKAIPWYEKVVVIDPFHEREQTQLKLSGLYLEQNNYRSAWPILKKCLQKYPNNKEFYLMAGVVMGNYNKFDEAIKLWQEGAALDPHDQRFSSHIRRAKELLKQKQ